MCGRIALYSEPRHIARMMEAGIIDGEFEGWRPSWNLGPTRRILGVSSSTEGERTLNSYRWGLVPGWAKDPAAITSTFNARAETLATKPMFRNAFKQSRILVPVDAFYEWKAGTPRQPHVFQRADGELIVFAGLRARWRGPDDAVLRTATIITTEAGPDMEGIHDRQPVVLERESWDHWLDPEATDRDELESMLHPSAGGTLQHHPVMQDVGNVRNDGAYLLEPIG